MARRVSRPAGPPPTRPIPTPPRQVPRSAHLPKRAIVFVGPMAAGKTSVGKRVAKELGVPFIDTDSSIQREHGSITDIFAKHGEAEFRRIEAQVVLREVTEPGTRVVSLGGGALLTASTRELLREYPVILLMTTEAAVLKTVNLAKRPLLRDDPGAWSRILEERRPLYEAAASVTFHTNRHSKENITRLIVEWIEREQQIRPAAPQITEAATETASDAQAAAGQTAQQQPTGRRDKRRRRRGRRGRGRKRQRTTEETAG